jgi:hypothetical protein
MSLQGIRVDQYRQQNVEDFAFARGVLPPIAEPECPPDLLALLPLRDKPLLVISRGTFARAVCKAMFADPSPSSNVTILSARWEVWNCAAMCTIAALSPDASPSAAEASTNSLFPLLVPRSVLVLESTEGSLEEDRIYGLGACTDGVEPLPTPQLISSAAAAAVTSAAARHTPAAALCLFCRQSGHLSLSGNLHSTLNMVVSGLEKGISSADLSPLLSAPFAEFLKRLDEALRVAGSTPLSPSGYS